MLGALTATLMATSVQAKPLTAGPGVVEGMVVANDPQLCLPSNVSYNRMTAAVMVGLDGSFTKNPNDRIWTGGISHRCDYGHGIPLQNASSEKPFAHETPLDHYCRNFVGVANCTSEASPHAFPTAIPDNSMPNDRACMAAFFVKSWVTAATLKTHLRYHRQHEKHALALALACAASG